MPLIPVILGWFGSGGVLFSVLAWIAKKITVKSVLVPLQFLVVGILFTYRMAMLTLFITFIVYIYNGITSLLQSISNTMSSSIFSLPIDILQSLGFFNALNDVFSTFSFIIITILVLYVSKAIVASIKLASDEFYKISMIISA